MAEAMMCPECGKPLVNGMCETDGCSLKGKKPKKDAQPLTVNRSDRMDTQWMTRPFDRTAEGFLRGRAIVTNVGVFEYRDATGKITREARFPEDVFDPASLESLKLKPLTNDHPSEAVVPENVRELQVGSLGDNPSWDTNEYGYSGPNPSERVTDGLHVAIDMVVTDSGAINDIVNGKNALSCGYTCELEAAAPGDKFLGMTYDYRQRNIRYNHVALVDSARAGSNARIRMDSAEALISLPVRGDGKEGSKMPDLKKLTLDGVEYQAEAAVITALSKANEEQKRLDGENQKLTAAKSALEGERDGLKAKVAQLETDLTKAKADASDPAKIETAVNDLLKLRETAKAAGVEVKDGMAPEEIKRAVILKVSPNAVLDGKDAAYIGARFDAAVEQIGAQTKADAEAREAAGGGEVPPAGQEHQDQAPDADKARDTWMKNRIDASRAPLGGK